MKDPTFEIRKYYIDALQPVLDVQVVNYATAGVEPPYVLVMTRAEYEGTMTTRLWIMTTEITIVVKAGGDLGGDAMTEKYSEMILERLFQSDTYGATANFDIITQLVRNIETDYEVLQDGRLLLKKIQIENYVEQKN